MADKILAVDDDGMCLQLIRRFLAEEPYETLTALSGIQAVHIIEETEVDLLLLDIEMPGMDGFAALEQIRALPAGRDVPVIFFTGRQDRDTVRRCAALGAKGYLPKPIEKTALIERIRTTLAEAAACREEAPDLRQGKGY